MAGNMESVKWGRLAWLLAVRIEAHETGSLWGSRLNKLREFRMRPHFPYMFMRLLEMDLHRSMPVLIIWQWSFLPICGV